MESVLNISHFGVAIYGIKIILSFLNQGSGILSLNLGGKWTVDCRENGAEKNT
jgi:hypothetical protein